MTAGRGGGGGEEAILLCLFFISACGLEDPPKALPFSFARRSNESSLAKFLKGWKCRYYFETILVQQTLSSTAICVNTFLVWEGTWRIVKTCTQHCICPFLTFVILKRC